MREREQMMMKFDFETVTERQQRMQREKEKKEFDDVTVNFTLVKPHPQYVYHTTLPAEGKVHKRFTRL